MGNGYVNTIEAACDTPAGTELERCLTIKRTHGLGNVFCLLPVLDELLEEGHQLTVLTRPEWTHAFSILRPRISWQVSADQVPANQETVENTEDETVRGENQGEDQGKNQGEKVIDLDELTENLVPCEHRVDEFGRLLGIDSVLGPLRLQVPAVWRVPFEKLAGSVVFAPEGGHSSRTWPIEQASQLKDYLADEKLVLVGTSREGEIRCDYDIRGRLQVHELLGLLSVAGAVITMDSAVLHIAAGLGVPTVAVFGGIDPDYRVRPEQKVVVVQARMKCCPCNKNEICADRFDCIKAARASDIAAALTIAKTTREKVYFHPA